MNIDQPLGAGGLQRIKQLADGHPVFLLSYQSGSCVIKSDGASRNKLLRDPIEIMNAVDPQARSRVLTKTELIAIKNWAAANVGSLDEQSKGYFLSELANALKPPLPPMPGQRAPIVQQSAVFFVMPAKKQLMDLKAAGLQALGTDDYFKIQMDDNGNPVVRDKGAVRQLADVFKQPGVLEKLGSIVAVDAFNGNQDRVVFSDKGGTPKWNGQSMKRIQNVGNIFVGEGGAGELTVLGLDVFDQYNSFKDFDTFSESSGAYPGRILRTEAAAKRKQLCQELANDIETVLGPRNRKLSILKQTRLPADAAKRIERGLDDGAKKILAHFKAKYAGGGIPAGMRQRFDACGWLTPANFPRP